MKVFTRSSQLQNAYEKLKAREKEYRKYARPSNLFHESYIWALIVCIFAFLTLNVFFNVEIPIIYLPIVAYSWWAFARVSTYFLDKKARVYRLNADERALFRTCSVLENLDNYFDSNKSELKKEHKKNALVGAKKLLSTVENSWAIGDFKLAREHFGDNISKLKINLRNRLVPTIEKGDENSLRYIEGLMLDFAYFLRKPSLSGLSRINESMHSKLVLYPSQKIGFLTRCSKFLRVHKALRHSLVTISLGIGCYFVHFLAINYDLASKDVAFATAIGLFGILLVGYWQYIKREYALRSVG